MNPEPGPIRRSARLESLLGKAVVAFESTGPLPASTLLPGEAAAVERAVAKRVGEFAAGRACARAALAVLGIEGFELRSGADRAPLWPTGITGSISHTDGFCGVVAARSGDALALGLDAEVDGRVGADLWQRICTEEERARLALLPEAEATQLATVIFSAKESFYKCQYPLTRQWLNFADIAIDVEGDRFRVVPQRPLAVTDLRSAPWPGRLLRADGLVITAVRFV